MQHDLTEIADAIEAARQAHKAIPPITDTRPDLTLADAMAVQQHNVQRRTAAGDRLVGYKLGNIAKVMQEAFGVGQPDYGHLLASDFHFENLPVRLDRFIEPYAEVEPAFLLKDRLEGPHVTVADVLRATEYVVPAIEIIDSRFTDWRIQIGDTLADNGSVGGIVLGTTPRTLREIDFSSMTGELRYDGERVGSGPASAVLGNPVAAIAWVANELSQYGIAFEPGQVILPGSCLEAVPLQRAAVVTAEFNGLGKVEFQAV
ncbi:2-hydroxypenta-2,4-dienoate hydratase [Streptomyces sp. Ru73]|uniref:2-keto-4-pentenoate hydratase n=1 Tax=Streptomyces sp. Ru73 TaxID=2080748 RepID=UPI000CDD1695|nr:fumarylacetoacetate hydrolase family protein [Streptomyces sp. Ru73]POX42824.1 2-hydroxypenta-2,4-dienoate hydratase [Streptomyces sp. Ru73]